MPRASSSTTPSAGPSNAVCATPRICASAWAWARSASAPHSAAIGCGCSTPSLWFCCPCSVPPARRSDTTAISNQTPPPDALTRCSAKDACSTTSSRPCQSPACALSRKPMQSSCSNSPSSLICSVTSKMRGFLRVRQAHHEGYYSFCRLLTVRRRVQREGEALPGRVTGVALRAVVARDLAIEAQRGAVVQMGCILAQVLGQHLTAQRAHNRFIPERGVHLGVAVQRRGVEVAGTDRGPGVVDQHHLAVHV